MAVYDPNCKNHGQWHCGNEPGCRCKCHDGGITRAKTKGNI
jgi:hypothetical protein